MFLDTIKRNGLKLIDFAHYLGMTKAQLDCAIQKNDPTYMRGLEAQFKRYLEWKIKRLESVLRGDVV